jgi:AraC-like DNA-binding protein
VLNHFSLAARVFYSGTLCQSTAFDTSEAVGYLHVLRAGSLVVRVPGKHDLRLGQPTVLFYPRPSKHRFVVDRSRGADLVCATLNYGLDLGNPLIRGLPDVIVIPLGDRPELAPAVSLLFAEGFGNGAGKQGALDRLFEYLLLLILRHAMDARLLESGVLAGLAHPKLSKAIAAVHEEPQRGWTLERLARKAGMSRSRFAFHFHRYVGMTALDYLTEWRVSLAQVLLTQGQSVKAVAPAVGYSSAAALNRVFRQRVGKPPRRWSVERQISRAHATSS